jgi:chaperonin GroEL
MSKNNTQDFNTSRDRLIEGIRTVYDIIAPTYGPNGGNMAIETNLPPFHAIYNDGKKIMDMIYLDDPVEQMGADFLKEACDKQEIECGDGRKTTAILTASILEEGNKSDISPIELRRQLDEELPKIIAEIDKQKKEIPLEDIGKVATIAAESEEIGKLIGEIYPKIGREGIIEVESSNLPDTFYEIVDGIRLHGAKKILDMLQFNEEGQVVAKLSFENPNIVIVKDKIMSVSQIEHVYNAIKRREVILYCNEIEPAVRAKLALSNVESLKGKELTRTMVIKAPVMFRDWLYEDLEKMTGATPIDFSKGITFTNFKEEYLGKVKSWKAEDDESRINGTKDISEHIKEIEQKIKETKDDSMKVRIGWLNTKVAILKVGANSESELSWKIRKTIDASNASKLALKDGVVSGAGSCLLQIETENSILKNAMEKPARIIGFQGFDMLNLPLDPAIVVKSALTTAVSLAGIILTTTGALVVPQYYKDLAREMAQRR